MDSETYEKLLHENITKSYKKTDKGKVKALKAFIKPFEAQQRSVKIKI